MISLWFEVHLLFHIQRLEESEYLPETQSNTHALELVLKEFCVNLIVD